MTQINFVKQVCMYVLMTLIGTISTILVFEIYCSRQGYRSRGGKKWIEFRERSDFYLDLNHTDDEAENTTARRRWRIVLSETNLWFTKSWNDDPNQVFFHVLCIKRALMGHGLFSDLILPIGPLWLLLKSKLWKNTNGLKRDTVTIIVSNLKSIIIFKKNIGLANQD